MLRKRATRCSGRGKSDDEEGGHQMLRKMQRKGATKSDERRQPDAEEDGNQSAEEEGIQMLRKRASRC
jgi:hypothetical protein